MSLSDIDGNGTQLSQSEACSEDTALNLALSSSVLANCRRFSNKWTKGGIKICGLYVILQNSLYYKKVSELQNLRFIIESSLKSRAGYNGMHTIVYLL